MELLAGLEPAASTYDHPSAAAALGAPGFEASRSSI